MAFRVGRGTSLLDALEAKRKAKEEQLKRHGETPPPQPQRVPVGRGALLEKYLKNKASVESGPKNSEAPRIREEASRKDDTESIDSGCEAPEITAPVIKKGTAGKRIELVANFLRLKVLGGRSIHEYHLKFDPPVDDVRKRESILHKMRDTIGGKFEHVFDGFKILFLPKLLPDTVTVLSTEMNDGFHCSVIVTYIGEKNFHDPKCIQFFNILFIRIMKILKYVKMKNGLYDPSKREEIKSAKLEIWPGYVTKVDEKEDGLMLTCDVSHRILRAETAYDVLNDLKRSKDFQSAAQKALLGQVVLTRYNNATYIVDGIDFKSSPKDKFDLRGTPTSFIEYYHRHYNIDPITIDPDQPMLVSNVRKSFRDAGERRIMLVPQVSFMTGLSEAARNNFQVKKDVSSVTSLTPAARELKIRKFAENIAETPAAHQLLSYWGLELERNPLKIEGRVLDPVKLQFGQKTYHVRDGDFSRALKTMTPLTTVNIQKWVLIYDKSSSMVAKTFLKDYQKVCQDLGISWTPPEISVLKDDRIESYVNAIRRNVRDDVQFNVTIMPSRRDDRYNAVKKLCFLDLQVINQVIQAGTLRKNKLDIVAKIALQINAKLGGELWGMPPVFRNSMIIGIDVWHPSDKRSQSVAGMVCTLNQSYTKYFSVTAQQTGGTELMDALKAKLVEALAAYRRENSQLPSRLVIFRDGVGEGRLNYTKDYEIPQLQAAFKEFGDNYSPELTFVVVSKHINEKFMQYSEQEGSYINPPPGAVVDHTVTRRNYFDFFLVSQRVRVGTVSPTHFLVLHNSDELSPDKVQGLSYRLTHMYFNFAGTIKVPAPCLYAHRLAYLCGENLGREAPGGLANLLYYL